MAASLELLDLFPLFLDLRPFFGSWFALRDHKQTGNYLGHELLRLLVAERRLPEIALVEDVEELLRPEVERLAGLIIGRISGIMNLPNIRHQ